MKLTDIVIILCRPSEPGNVGAVCRAMMNMGLGNLRICGLSKAGFSPFEGEIRSRAVHAAGIWEEARFFDTLKEAAADCAVLAGTTRRRGRRRKNVTMDCREFALWLGKRPGKAALAFGNERSGLDDGELALCNIASHIPTAGAFPSLNLSHAVQIYGYELFRALEQEAPAPLLPISPPVGENPPGAALVKGTWIPLDRSGSEALAAAIAENLESLGFYRHPGREEQTRFIRDFISRAALSRREGEYFGDIFAKAARLAAQGGPRKPVTEPEGKRQ